MDKSDIVRSQTKTHQSRGISLSIQTLEYTLHGQFSLITLVISALVHCNYQQWRNKSIIVVFSCKICDFGHQLFGLGHEFFGFLKSISLLNYGLISEVFDKECF